MKSRGDRNRREKPQKKVVEKEGVENYTKHHITSVSGLGNCDIDVCFLSNF